MLLLGHLSLLPPLTFFLWDLSGAPFSSIPASCCLCLISGSLGRDHLKGGEGHPWKAIDPLVFTPGQYPMRLSQSDNWKSHSLFSFIWIVMLFFAPSIDDCQPRMASSESLLNNCELRCFVCFTFRKIKIRKIVLDLFLTRFQGFTSKKSLSDFLKTACFPLPWFSSDFYMKCHTRLFSF